MTVQDFIERFTVPARPGERWLNAAAPGKAARLRVRERARAYVPRVGFVYSN